MDKNRQLLDYLCDWSGACYLSDLHYPAFYQKLTQLLEEISAEAYPLEEWQKSNNYILNEKREFTSSESARKHLLKEMSKYK